MKIKTTTGAILEPKDDEDARAIVAHTYGWEFIGAEVEKKTGRKAPDTSND